MATISTLKNRVKELKFEYDHLRKGKDSLLKIIDEAELSESVFNSNAIENSTLTLKETEKILLDMEVSRDVSVREIFEAKNLAKVMEYISAKSKDLELSEELILTLHKMLISNINDNIAGRFRHAGEYVRVGTYIAPAPEKIQTLMNKALLEYGSDHETYFADKIAKFHLDFESIHPFIDGNGRIGRVLINFQLLKLGFPTIIVRDKEKQTYYDSFKEYRYNDSSKTMEKIIVLALLESLHKRIAYLAGQEIVTLAEYSKKNKKSPISLLNAARRQSIAAFREKKVWKISISAKLKV